MHRWDDWDAYTETAGAMFATTHTPVARRVVGNANDKRSARSKAILHALPAGPR
jgi:polyphosphate kinase 2 (PPK2 family)